jgi:hypothetical protein
VADEVGLADVDVDAPPSRFRYPAHVHARVLLVVPAVELDIAEGGVVETDEAGGSRILTGHTRAIFGDGRLKREGAGRPGPTTRGRAGAFAR